jgi:hypothetical protein
MRALELGHRCVYCGVALNRRSRQYNGLNPVFYIPIDRGGPIEIDNLVFACSPCAHKYRPQRELRDAIPDINTFADYVEVLTKSVHEKMDAEKDEDAELVLILNEKIRRIKRLLNIQLEDIALSLKYKPFKDWIPERFQEVREDDTDAPTLIERVAENPTKENKEALTEGVKQIVSTGQYRIIE